jgi:hypothetical protein
MTSETMMGGRRKKGRRCSNYERIITAATFVPSFATCPFVLFSSFLHAPKNNLSFSLFSLNCFQPYTLLLIFFQLPLFRTQ